MRYLNRPKNPKPKTVNPQISGPTIEEDLPARPNRPKISLNFSDGQSFIAKARELTQSEPKAIPINGPTAQKISLFQEINAIRRPAIQKPKEIFTDFLAPILSTRRPKQKEPKIANIVENI